MFGSADSFNQNLGAWNVINLLYANDMFDGIALSTSNYDALLMGWDARVLRTYVTFSGGNSTYCYGESARTHMIDTDHWYISDGGKDCPDLLYCYLPLIWK